MAHVITNLCTRDEICITVCPVNCIELGEPQDLYPQSFIDPELCVDCDICLQVCPSNAIFYDHALPKAYIAKGGEILTAPDGTEGFTETYVGNNVRNEQVLITSVRTLKAGEKIDLTPSRKANEAYFNA